MEKHQPPNSTYTHMVYDCVSQTCIHFKSLNLWHICITKYTHGFLQRSWFFSIFSEFPATKNPMFLSFRKQHHFFPSINWKEPSAPVIPGHPFVLSNKCSLNPRGAIPSTHSGLGEESARAALQTAFAPRDSRVWGPWHWPRLPCQCC